MKQNITLYHFSDMVDNYKKQRRSFNMMSKVLSELLNVPIESFQELVEARKKKVLVDKKYSFSVPNDELLLEKILKLKAIDRWDLVKNLNPELMVDWKDSFTIQNEADFYENVMNYTQKQSFQVSDKLLDVYKSCLIEFMNFCNKDLNSANWCMTVENLSVAISKKEIKEFILPKDEFKRFLKNVESAISVDKSLADNLKQLIRKDLESNANLCGLSVEELSVLTGDSLQTELIKIDSRDVLKCIVPKNSSVLTLAFGETDFNFFQELNFVHTAYKEEGGFTDTLNIFLNDGARKEDVNALVTVLQTISKKVFFEDSFVEDLFSKISTKLKVDEVIENMQSKAEKQQPSENFKL